MIPMLSKKILRKARETRKQLSEKVRLLRPRLRRIPAPGTVEYAQWLATAPYADVFSAMLRAEKIRRVAERKMKRKEEAHRLAVEALENAITRLRAEQLEIAARGITPADSVKIDEIPNMIVNLKLRIAKLKRKMQ